MELSSKFSRMRNAVPFGGTVASASSWTAAHERFVIGALSVGGVFLLWELVVGLELVRSTFLVAPSEVVAAGIREVQTERFWRDVAVSLFEFLVGYVAAILLG